MVSLVIFMLLNSIMLVGFEFFKKSMKPNSMLLTSEYKKVIRKYYIFDIFIIVFVIFSIFLFLVLLDFYPINIKSNFIKLTFSVSIGLIYIINYKIIRTIVKMFIYE